MLEGRDAQGGDREGTSFAVAKRRVFEKKKKSNRSQLIVSGLRRSKPGSV